VLRVRTSHLAVITLVLCGAHVSAQDPAPVYQTGSDKGIKFALESILRTEWTDTENVTFQSDQRQVARVKPRIEGRWAMLTLGVGGDFVYSSDQNDKIGVKEGTPGPPPIIRDNYRSRDARLDLAFLNIQPASWFKVEAGRIPMPLGVTEMIWDRELRVQGAALTLQATNVGPLSRLALTGLGLRGGHVFEDEDTDLGDEDTAMLGGGLTAVFGQPGNTQTELMAAYMKWEKLGDLVPQIRRQNTRVAGLVTDNYNVWDFKIRLHREGQVPWQLVAEHAVNTAFDEGNKGTWAALVLGSTESSRMRLEYTYASVDKDATVAAYGADDFLWVTGWEGHRVDLGIKTGERAALHGVAQTQRFKDGPVALQQEWENRFRIEVRVSAAN
jgi:hypothetical protein